MPELARMEGCSRLESRYLWEAMTGIRLSAESITARGIWDRRPRNSWCCLAEIASDEFAGISAIQKPVLNTCKTEAAARMSRAEGLMGKNRRRVQDVPRDWRVRSRDCAI